MGRTANPAQRTATQPSGVGIQTRGTTMAKSQWKDKVSQSGKRICILCSTLVAKGETYMYSSGLGRCMTCHNTLEPQIEKLVADFSAKKVAESKKAGKFITAEQVKAAGPGRPAGSRNSPMPTTMPDLKAEAIIEACKAGVIPAELAVQLLRMAPDGAQVLNRIENAKRNAAKAAVAGTEVEKPAVEPETEDGPTDAELAKSEKEVPELVAV